METGDYKWRVEELRTAAPECLAYAMPKSLARGELATNAVVLFKYALMADGGLSARTTEDAYVLALHFANREKLLRCQADLRGRAPYLTIAAPPNSESEMNPWEQILPVEICEEVSAIVALDPEIKAILDTGCWFDSIIADCDVRV